MYKRDMSHIDMSHVAMSHTSVHENTCIETHHGACTNESRLIWKGIISSIGMSHVSYRKESWAAELCRKLQFMCMILLTNLSDRTCNCVHRQRDRNGCSKLPLRYL